MVRAYATIPLMLPADHSEAPVAAANPFTAADVLAILREPGWLVAEPSLEQCAWCERAASMLGGHATDRAALADLLGLVFHYDAREIISRVESHVVQNEPKRSEEHTSELQSHLNLVCRLLL